MSLELTHRQKEILEFVQNYIEFNGYPPTYREIGKHFGIASTFGVKRHLDALLKKGYLNMESNASRTLSLTELANENSTRKNVSPDILEIPVVGRVAAGQPILAEQNIEGTLAIQASMFRGAHDAFGLKVRGDSMIDAGIFEGDVVIVNPQRDANNGEIVVAMLENEATLKRYQKMNDVVLLIPENKNYQPIKVNNKEDFSIIGKVLGVFRWYN